MVHSIFLPYHFTYETHKSIDESLMGDEAPEQKKEQTYDLFLTQHYTSMRNSSFVNVDMLDETFFMSYLDMTSGGIKAFVDNGDNSKIVLSFGKGKNADGKESNLYISGKALTFEFGNTTFGLNEVTE